MPTKHKVKAGDCIASIAFENGFFWRTVWEDAANAALKRKRKSPFQLLEGDEVQVPDLRKKEESRASEQRHRFKLKGVPAVLIIAIRHHAPDEDEQEATRPEEDPQEDPQSATLSDPDERNLEEEPAANVDYRVDIEGRTIRGKTDDEGKVRITIMPNDREGMLTIEPGTQRERKMPLKLGGLDPIDSNTGVAQRLNNLGLGPVSTEPGVTAEELASAVSAFQDASGLSPTGSLDDTTRNRLKELHGS
ncbi:MAG TPA: peptidoglycan-binding domain-containing protein [Gammaproteobacteria bacterium]|nr:peptidoglycan-binding domain-containing protein [Gammaproteobacteria bacterium]